MRKLPLLPLLLLSAAALRAQNFWNYPETADRNTVFIGGYFAGLSVDKGPYVFLPEFHADYVLPVGLPFFIGAYFATPDPNLKSFGLRAGYHFDAGDENLDIYLFYCFDFGFTRNKKLLEYGDEKQEIRWYDFRAGIRRRFGRFFCLTVETGFKARELRFGVAIRI